MSKTGYLFAGVVTVGLLAGTLAIADDAERNTRTERRSWWSSPPKGVAPVKNEQYRTECGSCHMAYPPGLLPARSWQRMMGGLEDHFGDNAELDPDTLAAIEKYLVENAADRVDYRRSAKFNRSIKPGEAPLRVTETRYFIEKHDEIPAKRMVEQNPKVKSFSHCAACHTKAEEGNFDDDDVRIPGFEHERF